MGARGRSPLPWPLWALGLWLIGFVLTLLPTWIGLAGVGALARRSAPAPDGPLSALTASLSQEIGLSKPIRLLLGEAGTPMTWGWLRPVILLPTGADAWPADRLRAVLLHELAHIARADWPAQMASHLACALYWYNPAVWLAARQARLESERACDDRVLLAGIPAPDYARHLLDVARALNTKTLPAVLPMVRVSQAEGRLTALLCSSKRGEVTRAVALGCGLALLAGIMALAALRLTPKPLVTSLIVDGVRVQAEAWQAISADGRELDLTPRLMTSRTPDPNQHWETDILGGSLQWGIFQHDGFLCGATVPLRHDGPTECGLTTGTVASAGRPVSLYPVHQTYANINAQLCRYETRDERVTFHNVRFVRTAAGLWTLSTPRPLSVTTPSGVTLTLPPQGGSGYGVMPDNYAQFDFKDWYRTGLHCWVQVSPQYNLPQFLPVSPLCQTYHKPVSLQLLSPTAYLPLLYAFKGSSQSPVLGVDIPLSPPAGGVLKNLTFLVRQRVDIQKFPLSFAVPLETHAWPVFPKAVPQQHLRKGITS